MPGEYIESLKCEITFGADLNEARHQYEYMFRNVGDEPYEDNFTFEIPNATVDEIRDVVAQDGPAERQPAVTRQPTNNGSKIIFSNLAPVGAGQPRIPKFSYVAPSSTMKHRGTLSDTAFYRAHLKHTHSMRVATVTINLPKRSRIIEHVGDARITGAKIVFREESLQENVLYTFPIFFTRRKPLTAVALAAVPAVGGSLLDGWAAELLKFVLGQIRGG